MYIQTLTKTILYGSVIFLKKINDQQNLLNTNFHFSNSLINFTRNG